MDGLLVVDKPAGPTSHDVVARVRRVLRERRIGHTGTLDPMATGVLALVLGRATRLAQFLSGSDKSYDAVVRLGFSTDTGDALGAPIGEVHTAPLPARDAIDAALREFRGTFMQQPPTFSAKKINGKRSHKLARARRREMGSDPGQTPVTGRLNVAPTPIAVSALPARASVTTTSIEIVNVDGDLVTLHVECSAGFYIRSLAHDLGERLGTGAHLAALRRTRAGDCTIDRTIALETAERDPAAAAAAIIPLARMLPALATVTLTDAGVRRAVNGCQLGPADFVPGFGIRASGFDRAGESRIPTPESRLYRLLDARGALVAIARPVAASGLLHPSVVLM